MRITFETITLDDKNWVIDFGSLKPVKEFLVELFDHKLIIAEDDPEKARLLNLMTHQLADVEVLKDVGCEAFAYHIYNFVADWLISDDHIPLVRLLSVEVMEHGANAASYYEQ